METIAQKTPQCCGVLETLRKTQGQRETISRPITYGNTSKDLVILPWVLNIGKQRVVLNYCPFCGQKIS